MKKINKRDLYLEMFPDREASKENKHFRRFTIKELLKVKAQWAAKE